MSKHFFYGKIEIHSKLNIVFTHCVVINVHGSLVFLLICIDENVGIYQKTRLTVDFIKNSISSLTKKIQLSMSQMQDFSTLEKAQTIRDQKSATGNPQETS